MKYFNKNDWRYFAKADGRNDGKKFEALIERILELEYDSIKWVRTKESWDGSKDFYLYNADIKMWAECKNYNEKIGISVLSPTLIMAQIYDIDEVLFFSFSQINENARNKIIQYGSVCNLNIYFYDDTALEQVILKHKDILFPIFFMDVDTTKFDYIPALPQVKVHVLHKPLLAYKPDDEELFQKQFPAISELGQLMSLFISICNRSFLPLVVKIGIDNGYDTDFHLFEFFPKEIKNGQIEVDIPSFGNLSKQIFLKQSVYKEKVKFPKITITSSFTNQNDYTCEFQFKEYKCIQISGSSLSGSSYRNIADKFERNVSIKGKFYGLFLHGTSGVGKTRLLDECIQRSLNFEYRVLEFSGYRTSDERATPGVSFLVSELVYAAYNIPNEETLYASEMAIMGKETLNDEEYLSLPNDIRNALTMINDFSNVKSKEEMILLINRYIDVIFERLSKQHVLVSVDNIQFFDETVLYLIEMLIDRGANTNKKCGFALIGTFNVDYIPTNSRVMQLLYRLRFLSQIDSVELKGFANDGEASVFLLQLLNLSVDVETKYLMKIIDATGRNPFQIKQTITWLQEKQVILLNKTSFLIKDIDLFYKIINSIPSDVDKILRDRWMYFTGIFPENKCLLIISAIHFVRGISKRDAAWLGLNYDILDALTECKFIVKDNNLFLFEHDLLEKFFCEHYMQLSLCCVHLIIRNDLSITSLPIIQQIYIKMVSSNKPNESELFEYYRQTFDNQIPQAHLYEHLSLLFDLYVNNVCAVQDVNTWCLHVTAICAEIRNRLGSTLALPFYNEIGQLYKFGSHSFFLSAVKYGYYISRYCEVLNENGQYIESLDTLNNYMGSVKFESACLNEDREWKKLKCNLLNRRHCYKRHLCDNPEADKEILDDLFESIELSRKIKYDSIEYTNHSDWGYVYHCEYKNKSKILNIWNKACEYFENGLSPHSELNYIRKRAQIALINQDFEEAEKICLRGLGYADNGKYAYHQLFFKNWFYLNLAKCLLLNDPLKYNNRIDDALAAAEEYDVLLGSKKSFNIYYLRSLQYYYLQQYSLMLESFRKAYMDMKNSTYMKFKTTTLQLLADNLMVMGYPVKDSILEQLNFVEDKVFISELETLFSLDSSDYENALLNYKARSLIRSKDGRLNFPCI